MNHTILNPRGASARNVPATTFAGTAAAPARSMKFPATFHRMEEVSS